MDSGKIKLKAKFTLMQDVLNSPHKSLQKVHGHMQIMNVHGSQLLKIFIYLKVIWSFGLSSDTDGL